MLTNMADMHMQVWYVHAVVRYLTVFQIELYLSSQIEFNYFKSNFIFFNLSFIFFQIEFHLFQIELNLFQFELQLFKLSFNFFFKLKVKRCSRLVS